MKRLLSKLKNLWLFISQLGTNKEMSWLETVQYNILNQQGAYVLIFGVLLMIKNVFQHNKDIFQIIIVIILCSVVLWFTSQQKLRAAKIYWTVVFPIIILVLVITYGDQPHGEILFIIPIANTIILFSKYLSRIIIISFIILLCLLGLTHNALYPSIFQDITDVSDKYFTFLATILCLLTIINLFLTEHKHQLSLLRDANQNLKNANQDIESFTYMTSHNLRTPIRTILGFLELIERKKGDSNLPVETELNNIRISALQMNNLISDILEYAVFARSEVKELESISIETTISSIVDSVSFALSKKVELTFHGSQTLISDRTSIVAILLNLVENAVKYNTSEIAKIRLELNQQRNYYLLKISDNGIGINKKYYERIFIMFQRLHTDDEFEGTGIGLAMCKRLVNKLGGEIWLESILGEGTTFYVHLPIKKH